MFQILSQLTSLKGTIGTDSIPSFLTHGNGFLPLLALGAVMILGRSMLRLATGLIPITVMVLFMLGTDHETSKMLGSAGGISSALEGIKDNGWLPIALVVGGLLFLGRGRLFSLRNILAISAVLYLMGAKDFKLASVMKHTPSSASLMALAAIALVILILTIFRPRLGAGYYPYRGQLLAPGSLQSLIKYGAAAAALVLTVLLVTNPQAIAHLLPGWRTGVGTGVLLASIFALGVTLPAKMRVWVVPLFWSVVCVAITVDLYSPRSSTKSPPTSIEAF